MVVYYLVPRRDYLVTMGNISAHIHRYPYDRGDENFGNSKTYKKIIDHSLSNILTEEEYIYLEDVKYIDYICSECVNIRLNLILKRLDRENDRRYREGLISQS